MCGPHPALHVQAERNMARNHLKSTWHSDGASRRVGFVTSASAPQLLLHPDCWPCLAPAVHFFLSPSASGKISSLTNVGRGGRTCAECSQSGWASRPASKRCFRKSDMTCGCGSKPMAPFWGRCTTHFRTYFGGDWDVYWGYDMDFDPRPCG